MFVVLFLHQLLFLNSLRGQPQVEPWGSSLIPFEIFEGENQEELVENLLLGLFLRQFVRFLLGSGNKHAKMDSEYMRKEKAQMYTFLLILFTFFPISRYATNVDTLHRMQLPYFFSD